MKDQSQLWLDLNEEENDLLKRLDSLILLCFIGAAEPGLVRSYMAEAKLLIGDLQSTRKSKEANRKKGD